jgi:DNA mismatch repair protein MutS
VGEFIHKNLHARTLFATHYHELAELASIHHGIKNFNIAVKEWGENILFLRKVVEGSVSHSYGIQVARFAGIPAEVIQRAREILGNLESGQWNEFGQPRIAAFPLGRTKAPSGEQLPLFSSEKDPIIEEIRRLDTSAMTPIQALVKLQELKERADKSKDT